MNLDIATIGGVVSALGLLATAMATFLSRRQDQLRKDYQDALAELAKVNADLDESDRLNYQYRRALIRNGIPVPGEDDDDGYDQAPAARLGGRRRRPGPGVQPTDVATDPTGRRHRAR